MSFYKGNTILVSDQPKIKDRIFTMQYITQVNFCHSEKIYRGRYGRFSATQQSVLRRPSASHRHRIITNISSYVSECKIEHYLFVIVPQFAIFGK